MGDLKGGFEIPLQAQKDPFAPFSFQGHRDPGSACPVGDAPGQLRGARTKPPESVRPTRTWFSFVFVLFVSRLFW